TGRAQPSREMVLRLAEHLEVPLRERNALLMAAGYAPVYPATPLDEPEMDAARQAIDLLLAGHEPYPALAIDRHWNLVAANRAVGIFLAESPQVLLTPPLNVLRLSMHPDGLAGRISNASQWREHVLHRLRQQVAATGDPVLEALLAELRAFPVSEAASERHEPVIHSSVAFPLRMRSSLGELAFYTTTTIFGTATDITLAELAIETFVPANAETAALLQRAAEVG
ncbi:MAG: hypothetical protein M9890_06850, partial [Thermomicrobiales bacterium]|nr:hypothetical protein [Thermomicrobiales bacterium]